MTSSTEKESNYTYGHDPAILTAHNRRTAKDYAAFLLPHIKPTDRILDVGCGPGSITFGFAELATQGSVVGLDYSQDAVDTAEKTRNEKDISNLSFQQGNIYALPFSANTFDIVHCHAVLIHVDDPVLALREMRRVCKPQGIVAAREVDFSTFATHPPSITHLYDALQIWGRIAKAGGGEPHAGRWLVTWALEAGYAREDVDMSISVQFERTPMERAAVGTDYAKRLQGKNGDTAVEKGICTEEQRQAYVQAYLAFAKPECLDGIMSRPCNEIVCRKA